VPAVASGIESELTPSDHVVTAYRCHAYLLTRRCNVPLKGIFSELLGRTSGVSKGKGGSMHMYNVERNFWGGNGIVGAQVPLGAGLAYTEKYMNRKNVCFTFYGDGGANQGQVFEAYNMASLHKLPIVFVCENNHVAMGTESSRHSASKDFHDRINYLPGIKFDGMNVLQTREVAKFAINYAKTVGPLVLDAETYRFQGHSVSDPGITYRTHDQVVDVRRKRDPISYVKKLIIAHKLSTEEELKEIAEEITTRVSDAILEAKNEPWPEPLELFSDVYSCDYPIAYRGTEQMHNGWFAKS